ncbi:MAG: cyclic nucleotide-binding domain-containing protein [Planctomycetes bacterium]|nr:cyclic nucleotide-binding domain-containing protein [Planctomycetota bacterium]
MNPEESNPEALLIAITQHKFCTGLSDAHLKTLASMAEAVSIEPGRFLIREGGKADRFYLIRTGKLFIEMYAPGRGAVPITTIGTGDVLGWSWSLPPYRWHFDAKALTLTRVVSLDANKLKDRCDEDHDFGYEIIKRLLLVAQNRLQQTRMHMLDLYKPPQVEQL